MTEHHQHGYGVILVTFVLALIFTLMPLPAWLVWARPEWLALFLIYWTIALPHRVGMLTAIGLGAVLDMLEGAALGQNALSLGVLSLLSSILYQRMRVTNLWQQAAMVFMLVGINQLICQWAQNLQGVASDSPLFLLPAVSSALLWPVVLHLLRAARRHYEVT